MVSIYGRDNEIGTRWAENLLDALWNGKVKWVLQRLARSPECQEVRKAITYFGNNQHRMRYPRYRAMGLRVPSGRGSGTIVSGCKHVLAHRLRQAGMRWKQENLQALAKLRTRFKSDRWNETLALRPPPTRTYNRRAA